MMSSDPNYDVLSSLMNSNTQALKYFMEENRKYIRQLETELKYSNNAVQTLTARVDQLEQSVRVVQVKVFSGGPIDG